MTAPDTASRAQQADELVVLLNEDLSPRGAVPKRDVHHRTTPLHLAFSCWLIDGPRVLLTRRAAVKRTFPGLWTNAFCGHPGPGESFAAAIERRAAHELGATVSHVEPALPDFRYAATMPDGTMENEFCPVFVARLTSSLEPNSDEVDGVRWVPLDELSRLVAQDPGTYSPWLREQWVELAGMLPRG